MNLRGISLAIWLAAFAVRMVLIFGFHRQELGGPEPVRIAVALATTGSFADPYEIPTGPTAHTAPLYPLMLAPIYAVWGNTRTADLARVTFSAAGASAEYALLPWVASSLGMTAATGIAAGIAGAILPLHYWPECMGEFEVTWVALFLEISVILFARFMARRSAAPRSAVFAGLWSGAGLLLAPNLLVTFAGLLALAFARFRVRIVRWAMLATLTALVVVTPWIARNYVRLGGLFFIRDDLGLELHVSNNSEARADEEQNMATRFFHQEHPFMSKAAGMRIREQGELAFERDQLRQATAWIGAHPAGFLRLTVQRIVNFWFPALSHPLHRGAVWTLTIAAWIGLFYLSRENPFATAVLGTILASFSLVYYFVQNYLRYSHPIYWALLLLAAAPLSAVSYLSRSTADRARIPRSAAFARHTKPGRAG